MNFDSLSILMIWTAIAIYALAFIAYALDLGRRSQVAADTRFAEVTARELVAVGAATETGGAAASLSAAPAPAPSSGSGGASSRSRRSASSSTSPERSCAASPQAGCRGRTCTSSR